MYDLCVPEKKILGCVNRRRWLTAICGGLPFPQAGLTAETAWKVLSLIQRDWGDSYAPRNCSVLITVGATLNEYRADSWPVGYDSEFDVRSQNSFYKRTSEKKDRQKELLEEYLEKRAQAKRQQQEMLDEKIAKAEQERNRLAKAWAGDRQMAAASNAYDAKCHDGGSGRRRYAAWLMKGIMPGLTIREHGRLRMTEGPQVRFFKEGFYHAYRK